MSLTFKTAMYLCFPFLAALNSWGPVHGQEGRSAPTAPENSLPRPAAPTYKPRAWPGVIAHALIRATLDA
jgi:hypothetical protein